jgi:hypothetical protein
MDLTRREWLGLAASVGAGVLPVGCTGRPDKEATGVDEDVLAQFPGSIVEALASPMIIHHRLAPASQRIPRTCRTDEWARYSC